MDLSNFLYDLNIYFFSYYLNSIEDLVFVVVLVFIYFAYNHIKSYNQIWRLRESIPLSVGGWGTRGKSGTERIKSALFHGDGWETFSKTTGCEAMFVHSVPRLKLSEIFLYRPYDKATIWEQKTVLEVASNTESDVFLWECMALNPEYVKILQHEWMRDDYTTLTNAHPDHEDVQGPSGLDVANVIAEFIPYDKRTFTAEEQMMPLLRTIAENRGSSIGQLDWKDPLMISQDILERFPYEEHPLNISMIRKMAIEMGIDEDLSLRVMADDVVPDLGVLKVYPSLYCNDRALEFTNGMSANERFAALGNWERMGFKEQSMDVYDKQITVVVNNRADRVPRSKVFARLCVEGMEADNYIIIGTNVDGFMSFVKDSYEDFLKDSFIKDILEKKTASDDEISMLSNFFRVQKNFEVFKTFLSTATSDFLEINDIEKILSDKNADFIEDKISKDVALPTDLIKKINKDIKRIELFDSIVNNLGDANVKDKLYELFIGRFIPIFDSYASANYINDVVCKESYPNILNRIIGVQNIKGTGLGFAYSWEEWYDIYPEIEPVFNSKSRKTIESAWKFLTTYNTKNLIVSEGIKSGLKKYPDQSEEKSKLIAIFESDSTSDDDQLTLPNWIESLVSKIEQFLDPGDSVNRRKDSDRIYSLLSRGLITHSDAKVILQEIVYRQKGGWLKKRLVNMLSKSKFFENKKS